jgi:hypothetical protein
VNAPAWIAAASAAIAAAAFTFSIWNRTIERRATAVRDWQRVALYALIEDEGPVAMKDLKARYLERLNNSGNSRKRKSRTPRYVVSYSTFSVTASLSEPIPGSIRFS